MVNLAVGTPRVRRHCQWPWPRSPTLPSPPDPPSPAGLTRGRILRDAEGEHAGGQPRAIGEGTDPGAGQVPRRGPAVRGLRGLGAGRMDVGLWGQVKGLPPAPFTGRGVLGLGDGLNSN